MVSLPGSEELSAESSPGVIRPLQAAVRDFEHAYLLRALRATDGKRARTAELLGISRKTLWEKLRGTERPVTDSSWGSDDASLGSS
jgi:DNA-binding NtrC family response regulator